MTILAIILLPGVSDTVLFSSSSPSVDYPTLFLLFQLLSELLRFLPGTTF